MKKTVVSLVGTAVFLLVCPRDKGRTERKELSKMTKKLRHLVWLTVLSAVAGVADAQIATFEDLTLPPESYWNGSDGSGGFTSGSARFSNAYNADWGSWDGFSYSNITDTTTQGVAAQYNAIAGAGQGGSPNYAIGYVGWAVPPTVTLDAPGVVGGLYVTNTSYAYYSMLNGDAFAKKFGGAGGSDPDWFILTIAGKNTDGVATGQVDFYLADYRPAGSGNDYIVDTWQYVDLTSLGEVKSLEFTLGSSDVGDWGMNTPASFAVDSIVGPSASLDAVVYTEAGVNGYIDPHNHGRHADPQDPNAVTNPIFRGWATAVVDYSPAPGVDAQWADPGKALGPATGDKLDIVSLGDLNQELISQGAPPGRITLSFDEPIRQANGYDFVVFENGFVSDIDSDNGSVAGQMFTELGYVEVSSNGIDFVRFPAVSLTSAPTGRYGTVEISNVYNLAGKHPNAGGICTGTPFDLQEIADDASVVSGLVDMNDIRYVRIVDIPGSGDFYDSASAHIDPLSGPVWNRYSHNHPIYDAWVTFGSGGLDLEAVAVLHEQKYSADIDLNGVVDVLDFELFISALNSRFGQPEWIARCDLVEPKDLIIDISDLAVLIDQWQKTEDWR
jgi:hypothetical protein